MSNPSSKTPQQVDHQEQPQLPLVERLRIHQEDDKLRTSDITTMCITIGRKLPVNTPIGLEIHSHIQKILGLIDGRVSALRDEEDELAQLCNAHHQKRAELLAERARIVKLVEEFDAKLKACDDEEVKVKLFMKSLTADQRPSEVERGLASAIADIRSERPIERERCATPEERSPTTSRPPSPCSSHPPRPPRSSSPKPQMRFSIPAQERRMDYPTPSPQRRGNGGNRGRGNGQPRLTETNMRDRRNN